MSHYLFHTNFVSVFSGSFQLTRSFFCPHVPVSPHLRVTHLRVQPRAIFQDIAFQAPTPPLKASFLNHPYWQENYNLN